MKNIILAFVNETVSQKIKTILASSGLSPVATAESISQVISISRTIKGPKVVICQTKLSDGHYNMLAEMLMPEDQIIVLVKGNPDSSAEQINITTLTLPLKKQDLIDTVRMLLPEEQRKVLHTQEDSKPSSGKKTGEIRQRTPEEKKLIEDAKNLLMTRNNLTEAQAHRFLQKKSMDNGTRLTETATALLERW